MLICQSDAEAYANTQNSGFFRQYESKYTAREKKSGKRETPTNFHAVAVRRVRFFYFIYLFYVNSKIAYQKKQHTHTNTRTYVHRHLACLSPCLVPTCLTQHPVFVSLFLSCCCCCRPQMCLSFGFCFFFFTFFVTVFVTL